MEKLYGRSYEGIARVICSVCGKDKECSSFPSTYKRRTDGSIPLSSTCKDCKRERLREWRSKNRKQFNARQREYSKTNRFAVSLIESRKNAKRREYRPCEASIATLKDSFTGKCFVCGITEDQHGTLLHMDHCHETGRFRGWLCNGCNLAAGCLHDSPSNAFALSEYLKRT